MDLIIVESPAKVKTIKKFLGNDYLVSASVGHVVDLPKSKLGIDESNNFAPDYVVMEQKQNVVKDLKALAKKANIVYLASDPDREGEAIAYHVSQLLKPNNSNIKRIQFNEITERAVKDALQHPREINMNLFYAQQARRLLDRLVGYKISPLLWNTIKRGISAGRVQSVALKLIVEREFERRVFEPQEYWQFKAHLSPDRIVTFKADLHSVNGEKAIIHNKQEADAVESLLQGHPFIVKNITMKDRVKAPSAPFITSTLQQSANQRLGYSSKRTMSIAQKLYEGITLGKDVKALITYMRTDSTRIADEAREATKHFIMGHYGAQYLPEKDRIYTKKGHAQDAHEAIRPVDVRITPESIRDRVPSEYYSLYNLIWCRFVASQMASATFHDTTVDIECHTTLWRAKGETIIFPGYLAVLPKKDDTPTLPDLQIGQTLYLMKLDKEQKFTQPPARYNDASLVKKLEECGIGRPSTYASIISTLLTRRYIDREEKSLYPTDLGIEVCTQLDQYFTVLMRYDYTANMETALDKIAVGDKDWVNLMKEFTQYFHPTLENATKSMKVIKGGKPIGMKCPECGKDLVIKFGSSGGFIACTGYPECKYTSDYTRDEKGNLILKPREEVQTESVGTCPLCGKDLIQRTSRKGAKFIGCSGYPDCKYIQAASIGVTCPKCGKGNVTERRSKKGRLFYSCDQYPHCDFISWNKPINKPCPLCHSPYLVEATSKKGTVIKCPNKECAYVEGTEG